MCVHSKNKMCDILEIDEKPVKCTGQRIHCKFRKTHTQIKNATEKVYKRLASLPFEVQNYISLKYYDGLSPWKLAKKATINRKKVK